MKPSLSSTPVFQGTVARPTFFVRALLVCLFGIYERLERTSRDLQSWCLSRRLEGFYGRRLSQTESKIEPQKLEKRGERGSIDPPAEEATSKSAQSQRFNMQRGKKKSALSKEKSRRKVEKTALLMCERERKTCLFRKRMSAREILSVFPALLSVCLSVHRFIHHSQRRANDRRGSEKSDGKHKKEASRFLCEKKLFPPPFFHLFCRPDGKVNKVGVDI